MQLVPNAWANQMSMKISLVPDHVFVPTWFQGCRRDFKAHFYIKAITTKVQNYPLCILQIVPKKLQSDF